MKLQDLIGELEQKHVKLIAVSKTKSVEEIRTVYNTGIRDFGENKVQELISKHEQLPDDIHWHLIGHLQTNKVKYIAPFVHIIHSVDSLKLLVEINKQAEKNNRIIDYLFQIHIAREETKFGLRVEECSHLLNDAQWTKLKHIRLRGLMAMASNTSDANQISEEFTRIRHYFMKVKQRFNQVTDNICFDELCIGMSSDYAIAIACGTTMVRIGSLIFGSRNG
jgi:pyridoxal phosphate enzyme (YggS family)